jgi:hypothetical protein
VLALAEHLRLLAARGLPAVVSAARPCAADRALRAGRVADRAASAVDAADCLVPATQYLRPRPRTASFTRSPVLRTLART